MTDEDTAATPRTEDDVTGASLTDGDARNGTSTGDGAAETAVDDLGAEFRRTLGQYPTGVTIVTGVPDADDEAPAMVIGSFGSVSLDPPLVMFLPGKSSSTWPLIEAGGHFGVSVLGAGQDEVANDLFKKTGEHYDAHEWTLTDSGTPVLTDGLAWLDCTIRDVHDAGDHWIVVGAVEALGVPETGPTGPLVFWQGKYLLVD